MAHNSEVSSEKSSNIIWFDILLSNAITFRLLEVFSSAFGDRCITRWENCIWDEHFHCHFTFTGHCSITLPNETVKNSSATLVQWEIMGFEACLQIVWAPPPSSLKFQQINHGFQKRNLQGLSSLHLLIVPPFRFLPVYYSISVNASG